MQETRILRNITDGVKIGLVFSIAFSLIAIALFALSHGTVLDGSPFTLVRVIAAYVVGGVASGAVFGLLRPLARWTIGAAILGMIVMVPAYAGMRFAIQGFAPWSTSDTSEVLVLSSLIGGLSGVMLRHRLIKRGLWNPR